MADLNITVDSSEVVRAGQHMMQFRDQTQQMARTARQSAGPVSQLSLQAGSMGRTMNRMGVLTQQAGYQVGDFIVQVQSGTNAFVAFGQQATQVAGTLTLLGGKWIMIGTALGIAIPLLTAIGAAFMRTRNSAEEAADETFRFVSALGDLESISGRTNLFAGLPSQIEASLEPLRGFLESGMVSRIREQFRSIANTLTSDISANILDLEQTIENAEIRAAAFRAQIEASGDTIPGLNQSLQEQLAIIQQTTESISRQSEAFTIIRGISGQTRQEFVDSFALAVRRLETENLMTDAIRDSLFAFADTNGLAAELVRLLGEAADEASRVSENLILGQTFLENSVRAGVASGAIPGQALGDIPMTASEEAYQRLMEMRRRRASAEDSAGGGGAARIRQTREEMSNLNHEMSRGVELQLELAESFSDTFGDALVSMVDGTKSVSDAFKDMARSIISELYDVLVVQQLVGQVRHMFAPGTSSAASGILGGILGVSGKASGGFMMADKPYMVGERGPELVIPGRSSTVVNSDLTGKMGGGQPAQVINMSYNFTGGVTEADLARAMPQMVEQTKRAVVDTVQRGGNMARVFR